LRHHARRCASPPGGCSVQMLVARFGSRISGRL
jgi:hypothetical protein